MKQEKTIFELKTAYQNVEIPAQLETRVQDTVRRAEAERHRSRKKKTARWAGSFAAALALFVGVFGVGVRASTTFAYAVSDIPVLGSLARVFTAQTVHETTDAYVAQLEIPGVEGLKDERLQREINELVRREVTAATDETAAAMAEYKEAYLETGGTEESYSPREILVDYDVKCVSDSVLSFGVFKTETLASAYFDMFYYNYDLKTGKPATLQDLLGADYQSIANRQIKAQIAQRAQLEGNVYWDAEDEFAQGFSSIDDKTQFYINAAGNPVVVFNKYEIAPGSMGVQEFEIVKP